ncbi:MAG: glycerol-3-phosphate 1-O-acyltransferase PlsY [bacterium]|nr:glycerol-3-phosphate 1-O-acyltransferase PlsY [bacterium]
MLYFKSFILFLVAYLIGAIPTGLILTKIFLKQDVRSIGSGSTGATNVLRTGSKLLAFLTLVIDALKPYIATIAVYFSMRGLFGKLLTSVAYGLYDEYITMAICGIAIFAHCYPIYLKFKGGKGVATAFGTLFLFSAKYYSIPVLPVAALSTWLLVAFVSKKSSLSALTTALILPVYVYYLNNLGGGDASRYLVYFYIGAVVFVIFRHHANIARLIKGTESNIKLSKDDSKKK